MRGRIVITLACAGALCVGTTRQACAQRGGGLGARVGSVRYAGGGSYGFRYDDDQAWTAGFDHGPTPSYSTGPKEVATVKQDARSDSWRPTAPQNRINALAPSTFNSGSIQNSDSLLRPADLARVSGRTGDNPVWLLVKMSDYLARQRQITLWITQTSERVTESGEKIQLSSRQITYAQRPDRLAVDVTTSDTHTRIVYDGTGVTTLDTTRKLYGVIPIQGDLDSVLDTLARDYGMAVPADDLLCKGSYTRIEKKIKAAQDLGVETIDGQPCYHAAFMGNDIDFEVWIQSSGEPMPRRVVIFYKNTPARPRCMLEITRWDTGPIPASVFKVDVPAGAQQIRILPHR